MLPLSTVALFVAAALALLLIPGPSVLYIVARSMHQGRKAGLVSAAGVGVGSLVHITAATLGLSALLVSSALAFAVVKYLGAAYLIWIGLRTLLARPETPQPGAAPSRSLRRIFVQGILVNTLNPKTALFFFAFLPQFVDPARGSVAAQIGLLGLLMVALGTCTDSTYALLSGTLGGLLRGSARFARIQQLATGTVYIALGVSTAFTGAGSRK